MNHPNPLETLFRETVFRLREADIPFWLEFGALLGLVRQGSLLPWDRDIDLGLWRGDAAEETLINLFEGDPFTLRHDPGSDYIRIGLKDGNLPAFVDLNLYAKKAGKAVAAMGFSKLNPLQRLAALGCDALAGREHAPHENPLLNRIQRGLFLFLGDKVAPLLPTSLRHRLETYPRTLRDRTKVWAVYEFPARFFEEFKEIELFGLPVSIPKNAVGYLEAAYGKDWRVPRKWKHWSEGAAYITDGPPFKNLRRPPPPGRP